MKFVTNKISNILLALIILLAAFLRLYRISDYMTFLGDEGRDVLVAKGILEGNLTLLGPRASAGDFYLGPIYYYMIAPFLWFFRYDPVGPSIMVALIGVATVFLVYYVGKKFFNVSAGIFAAALYAVSPLVITYSHSSWNPNPLPFFSLLIMYLVYKSLQSGRHTTKYFLIMGFLLGIALQLHYLAMFIAVIVFLQVLFGRWYLNKKINVIQYIKNYLQIFGGFLVGFSPFIAFEIRHGFPNSQTIFKFIFSQTAKSDYDTKASFITTISDVSFRSFGRLVYNFPTPDRLDLYPSYVLQSWTAIVVISAIVSVVLLFYKKEKLVTGLLCLWLFVGLLLFGLYKKPIFDYYLAFLFPLPFLLLGNMFSVIFEFKNKLVFKLLTLTAFLSLFLFNLWDNPFRHEPNRQKNQIKVISEFVVSKTDNKPFNFALIAGGNSDHGYRYYFDVFGRKPTPIENLINDPERSTVTDQLMIVCEEKVCKPLGYPLFEVANFGRAEIVGEWNVSVVKVFKLVPYKEKE